MTDVDLVVKLLNLCYDELDDEWESGVEGDFDRKVLDKAMHHINQAIEFLEGHK